MERRILSLTYSWQNDQTMPANVNTPRKEIQSSSLADLEAFSSGSLCCPLDFLLPVHPENDPTSES